MVKPFLNHVVKMIKAKLKSNENEIIRFEEDSEERRIHVTNFLELSHYIIPALRFGKFARKYHKEQEEGLEKKDFDNAGYDFEKEEDKPLMLEIGPFRFNLD